MKIGRQKLLLLVLEIVSFAAGDLPYVPLTPGMISKSETACRAVAKEPYFSLEKVIKKPWRIYYMWNVRMEDKCVDIYFQIATPAIISRIYYDMSQYIVRQPDWERASLLMTTGRARQEMLLIPDQGTPGRFLAVPNDFSDSMPGGQVPVLKFQMKLMRRGKFLVFMDCQVGIASIAARVDELAYRMDLDTLAMELLPFLGVEGSHACTNENNSIETVVSPFNETPKPPLVTHV